MNQVGGTDSAVILRDLLIFASFWLSPDELGSVWLDFLLGFHFLSAEEQFVGSTSCLFTAGL